MHWVDLADVHEIERDVFGDSAWSPESFWAELAGAPATRAYWVAERARSVVGYVGLRTVPPDADIQTLAVARQHRRTGVARELLATAITEAESRGCRTLTLEVTAGNHAARTLYERVGFASMARRTSYYGPGRDAVVMRLTLPGRGDRSP